jgi:hypothetical protein
MICPGKTPSRPVISTSTRRISGRRSLRRFSVRSVERSQPEILCATATISSAGTGLTR